MIDHNVKTHNSSSNYKKVRHITFSADGPPRVCMLWWTRYSLSTTPIFFVRSPWRNSILIEHIRVPDTTMKAGTMRQKKTFSIGPKFKTPEIEYEVKIEDVSEIHIFQSPKSSRIYLIFCLTMFLYIRFKETFTYA